jgi:malate dehydrogenase (oxaloacetate-decarboxylating)
MTMETSVITGLRGRQLLRDPALNKGVAFTAGERSELGLLGLLPPTVLTLEDQVARAYWQYTQISDDLGKAILLSAMQNRNQTLFYRLLIDHLPEMLPIVYTPTVGMVIQQYSRDYRRPIGVYLSIDELDSIEEALTNYGLASDEVDLVVVTDGEGILGIGDWGVGGVAIAVGKLAVYTAAAGIDPSRVVPVMLDVGTNNQELLDDPMYVGARHPRVTHERYDRFVDRFVRATEKLFPQALLHWEDFGADNATRLLQRYRSSVCTFNDDVQGTGAVVLAAAYVASAASGLPLAEQRVVVFGAGSAGIRIADQIRDAMVRQGLPLEEAVSRFWCLGRRGLLVRDRPGIRDFQRRYARAPDEVTEWSPDKTNGGIDLLEVVRRVRPSILIGTSATPGAFTEAVVREMGRHVDRPVILPLSNPTSLSEAVPSDLISWTDGRALVATGSPFPPLTRDRITYVTAQANNALVFPGLGLGVVVSRARLVTDGMLVAAAQAVASTVDATSRGAPILPEVNDLRSVSAKAVQDATWNPVYRQVQAR